jgi:hypothetical protein
MARFNWSQMGAAALLAGVAVLLSGRLSAVDIPATKYKISVKVDKHKDFRRVKTYAWTYMSPSDVPEVDPMITAAVERELRVSGISRVDHGPADALVRYMAVSRVDVQLHTKPHGPYKRPEYVVATLIVAMLDPEDEHELFWVRSDTPITAETEEIQPLIDRAVNQMFSRYPMRRDKDNHP